MFGNSDIGDLENSFLSWISDHLGEKSYMEDKVKWLPSSPLEESSEHEENPEIDNRPPLEREITTMTQINLDRLRESCSFLFGIQARLPDDDEATVSTRPDEVVFYEYAFHAGLRLPIHSTIRKILHFYIFPTQLSPTCGKVSSA